MKSGWELIADGNDSKVYIVNDVVAKVYSNIACDTLRRYYSDTAIASSMMKIEAELMGDFIGKFYDDYTLGVTVLNQGRIIQMPGMLIGIGQKYINAETIASAEPLFDENPESVNNAIESALKLTKALVKQKVGIYYDIAPVNVKLDINRDKKRLELIITDLAKSIQETYVT